MNLKKRLAILMSSFWLSCQHTAFGYPNGAPRDACWDFYPYGHGGNPQTAHCAYTIEVADWDYYPEAPVAVTLKGGHSFRGFILQARQFQNRQQVGKWVSWTRGAKLMSCRLYNDTLTHVDSSSKHSIVAFWLPYTTYGDVQFQATVVLEKKIYWTNIKSAVIPLSNSTYRKEKYFYSKVPISDLLVNGTGELEAAQKARHNPVLTLVSIVVGYLGAITVFSFLLI